MMNTPFMVADGTTFRARQVLRMLASRYPTYALVVHYSNQAPDLEMERGVTALPLPGKFKQYRLLLYAFAFIKTLGVRPDILYAVNDSRHFRYNRFIANLLGIPMVHEMHSIGSKETEELGRGEDEIAAARERERRIATGADHIVVLSEEAAAYYDRYKPDITLIPATVLGVKERAARSHRAGRDTRVVGLIGPFERRRNVAELQFVTSNLDKFDPRIRIKVIGICTDRVEDPRLDYTGLIKSKEEYLDTVSRLDAVLVPSSIATFGPLTKIVETMSLGVPVFTTPKGATGIGYLEDGANIIIASEDDLVDTVNQLVFDEAKMRDIGQRAMETIKQHYSEAANAERLYGLIERALG